jgi:LSD1 subclass zinc finger protein
MLCRPDAEVILTHLDCVKISECTLKAVCTVLLITSCLSLLPGRKRGLVFVSCSSCRFLLSYQSRSLASIQDGIQCALVMPSNCLWKGSEGLLLCW